jgi:hypothetical protein
MRCNVQPDICNMCTKTALTCHSSTTNTDPLLANCTKLEQQQLPNFKFPVLLLPWLATSETSQNTSKMKASST